MSFTFSRERIFYGRSEVLDIDLSLESIHEYYKNILEELIMSYNQNHTSELNSNKFYLPLIYMGDGYINNAYDSIILRNRDDNLDYYGKLELALKADEEIISFRVKDNGIGINYRREKLLFKHQVNSEKAGDFNFAGNLKLSGGAGVHLFIIRERLEELKGKYGYTNLGLKVGAEFWYEVPIVSLK